MSASDMVGSVIDGLMERRRPHCYASGPGDDRCGRSQGHEGWHQSNFHGWPNEAESMEKWAAIGRRLLGGEPMVHLSFNEMKYAVDAAQKLDAVGVLDEAVRKR